MKCRYPEEIIKQVITFHGHSCPGLAIGIRAAEYALSELPDTDQASRVCVTETDMCGVDAIQFLTGCTFGKGNLIHRDYGKTAFSFFDRAKHTGFRLIFREEARGPHHQELSRLMAKNIEGTITEEERQLLTELRHALEQQIMAAPLGELFVKVELNSAPPRGARILQSLACEDCGEKTMESRTRRFGGKTLCIPCFRKVEQKI